MNNQCRRYWKFWKRDAPFAGLPSKCHVVRLSYEELDLLGHQMPSPPKIFRVRISGPEEKVRKFLAAHTLEPQSVNFKGNQVSFDAFVTEKLRDEINKFGLKFEEKIDFSTLAQQRQDQVGKGNRFAGGRIPPGLGILTRKP